MNDSDLYKEAQRRVKEKKKFHDHLRSYIIVNVIMVFTGVFFNRGWLIAAFFWGIGLFSHYLKAYQVLGTSEWEREEIEREIRKMKSRKKRSRSAQNHPIEQELPDLDEDAPFDLDQPRPQPRKNYSDDDLV